MKEFNIPAPLSPFEINRTAFSKKYWKKIEREYLEPVLPHLEKLEDLGLIPQTVAIRKTRRRIHALMERVNGFELASFPSKYEDYKFSVDLAKKTANLFQGFFEAGYYHGDLHSRNIMYDQVKNRCIAVDLESVHIRDTDMSLANYVLDYADLMLSIYSKEDPLDILPKLFYQSKLQQYMLPEKWENFSSKADRYEIEYPDKGEFYNSEIISLLRGCSYRDILKLIKESLGSKPHPVIKDFILRGLDPVTCPENFGEILSLKSEIE